ncbi:MAG: helix-turn-helix transcriptional regulator [Anaerolineae bacterium]
MCQEHCGKLDGEMQAGCCPSGGLRGFLQPRLLLLLLEQPGHGYELLERLAESDGLPAVDPGLLYRTLRNLEAEGLVQSTWDTEGQGPARRRYEVTPAGVGRLHAWAERIRHTRSRLDLFLEAYTAHFETKEGL